MTELTPKQEAFCLAYIETGNASEAYRQAYEPKI
ncbi:Terminase small subunit [Mannheimia haemolytica]|nr:Terminase small subunit [Mannheimia haemolytica]